MADYDYIVLDVFTDTAFGGNPLAVIPDATALPEASLQNIAREFGFSETTFVFPPDNPAHRARVRIFTPVNEIPFAGHPTIGTAIALADGSGGRMVLELGVGPMSCSVTPGPPASASFTTSAPLTIQCAIPPETIAACLALEPCRIKTRTHAPEIASLGLPFALVELTDKAALDAATPVTEAFRTAEQTFANGVDFFAIFLYVRDGTTINARMFAPLSDVPEDPATGSASATLAAYLAILGDGDLTLAITQGEQMGRPSRIGASARIENGRLKSVTVRGQAIEVMRGTFRFARP